MSKHNYSQYSNNKKNKPQVAADLAKSCEPKAEVIEETPVVVVEEPTVVEVKMVEETVDTIAMPKRVVGVVANCAKLNVREKAVINADIVCILDVGTEVEINPARSSGDWLNVYTAAGVEGFCMRKFVNAKL